MIKYPHSSSFFILIKIQQFVPPINSLFLLISVPLRYFNRMFVVAPGNGTVTIVNDILFVTVPTKEQLKVNHNIQANTVGM